MEQLLQTPRLGASAPPISTLVLTQWLDTGGTYPQPGPGPATNVLAMVHTMAGNISAYGAMACHGQQLPAPQNQPLVSLLGMSFGTGRPGMTVGLPDLRGRIAVGDRPGTIGDQTMGMTWMIAVNAPPGQAAYPMLGALGLFAGWNAPGGWLPADGSLLPLRDNLALFQTIGTAFGGDGISTFALPNLGGRAAIGAGQGLDASISLGQKVEAGPDTSVACLGLNYIVNVSGALPPGQGNGGFPNSASVLGEVVAFAGPTIPPGWLPAAGQEMPIDGNADLFKIVGNTFGGDGETSFALPDLRTRLVAGG